MTTAQKDYQFLANLVKTNSGINIEEDKYYLFDSRLHTLLKKYGVTDLTHLVNVLRNGGTQSMITDIVELMTTNESLFFRDIKIFEQYKNIIFPEIVKTNPSINAVRIWSAACSTGQEAYSLAVQYLENKEMLKHKIEIIGTDIANVVVDKAKKGEYTQFEVQRGMPISLLMKYFTSSAEKWTVQDNVKSLIKFSTHNLLSDPPSNIGTFDIVFLRNVLIYFDQATKTIVMNKIMKAMNPGGYLILGSSENLNGLDDKFAPVPNTIGIYKLK